MQYIRELMFGAPGSGKTYSHGNTYPTPMLILNTDPGGTTCIAPRKVNHMSSVDFQKSMQSKVESWSDVTVLDYATRRQGISTTQLVQADRSIMDDFIRDVNVLTRFMPFKTIVLDNWTGFDAFCLDFIWALNGQSLGSLSQYTMQYYGQLALKKQEVLGVLLSLPCHVCVIAHEEATKDDLTGTIEKVPAGTGKLQQTMAKTFAQVLYATTEDGKDGLPRYVCWTAPKALVKGMKLPQQDGRPHKPAVVENNFKSLYE